MGSKSVLSIKYLESLVENSEEGVTVETSRYHIALHPAQLQDFKGALRDEIGRRIARYDIKLFGILLGFKNVIPASSLGKIGPTVGMVLNGVVTKCAKDHVGCLIYKTFNVSLPKSAAGTEHEERWVGSKAQPGEQVSFEIVYLDLESRMPYIRGKILSLGSSLLETTDDQGQNIQNSKKTKKDKKKKDKNVNSIAIEENSKETEGNDINDLPLKKKKTKKRKHNESEFEDLLYNQNRFENIEDDSPKKKKKKKTSLTFESSDIDSSLSNPHSLNITEDKDDSPKKKKKKKTSLTFDESKFEDILYNQNSFENKDDSPKKKKKKKASLTFESSDIDSSLSNPNSLNITKDKGNSPKKKSSLVFESSDIESSLSNHNSSSHAEDKADSPKQKHKKKTSLIFKSSDIDSSLGNHNSSNITKDRDGSPRKKSNNNSLTIGSSQVKSSLIIQGNHEETLSKKKKSKNKSLSPNLSREISEDLITAPNKQAKKETNSIKSQTAKEFENSACQQDSYAQSIGSVISGLVSAEISENLVAVPNKQNKKERRKFVSSQIKEKIKNNQNENAKTQKDFFDEAIESVLSSSVEKQNKTDKRKSANHNLPIQRILSVDSKITNEKQKGKSREQFTDSDSFVETIDEVVEKFCSDIVPDLKKVNKAQFDMNTKRKNITMKNKDESNLEKERDTSIEKINTTSELSIEPLFKTPTRDSTSRKNSKNSQNDSDSSLDRLKANKKIKTEPKTPIGSPVRDLGPDKLLKNSEDNCDSTSVRQIKSKTSENLDYVIRTRINGIVSDWEVEDFSQRKKRKKIISNEVKEEVFSDGENLKTPRKKPRNRSQSFSIYDRNNETQNEVKEEVLSDAEYIKIKSKKKDGNSKSISLNEKEIEIKNKVTEVFSDGKNLKTTKKNPRSRSKSFSVDDRNNEIQKEEISSDGEYLKRKSKKKDRNSISVSLDEKDLDALFSSPAFRLELKNDHEQTFKKKRKSLSRSLDYSDIKMKQSSDIDDLTVKEEVFSDRETLKASIDNRNNEIQNEFKEEVFSDGEDLKRKSKNKDRNSKSLSLNEQEFEIQNKVTEVFSDGKNLKTTKNPRSRSKSFSVDDRNNEIQKEEISSDGEYLKRKSKKKDRNSISVSLDEKDLDALFSSPAFRLELKNDHEQTFKKKRKSLSRSLDYSDIKMKQSSDIDDLTESFSFSKNHSLNDLGLHTEIDLGIKDDCED